jgi:hypothetical protein
VKTHLKIVSGGQTGVDRAALDVALELGIPCGGWCPQGRRAEDGVIAKKYPLRETPTAEYAERTEWNVRESDGTLVLTRGEPAIGSGTAFTIELARVYRRPHLIVDLVSPVPAQTVRGWIGENRIRVLNVAGPRAEGNRGIYKQAVRFLRKVFSGARDRT